MKHIDHAYYAPHAAHRAASAPTVPSVPTILADRKVGSMYKAATKAMVAKRMSRARYASPSDVFRTKSHSGIAARISASFL